MNMHSRSLGVVTPGRATAPLYLQTPFQGMGQWGWDLDEGNMVSGIWGGAGGWRRTHGIPLSGIGDFVPSKFPVPFNPISGMNGLGMGAFVPACFPIPQNPIADAAHVIPAKSLNTGIGCASCGGGCGGGMGDVNSFTASLTSGDWTSAAMNSDFVSGIPNILLLLGGIWFVGSVIGDTKRVAARVRQAPGTAKRKASAAYRAALAA